MRYRCLLLLAALLLPLAPARARTADDWMRDYARCYVELLEAVSDSVRHDAAAEYFHGRGVPLPREVDALYSVIAERLQSALQWEDALSLEWHEGDLERKDPDHDGQLRILRDTAHEAEAILQRASIPPAEQPAFQEAMRRLRFMANAGMP